MSIKTNIIKFVICCLILGFPFFHAPRVGAFFLNDWFNAAKELVQPKPQTTQSTPPQPTTFTINSDIKLAPNGDLNKNSQIDSGDTVTFSFNIINPTDQKYYFSTLKTNLDKSSINFIHNVYGVTGLLDDGKTVYLSNLRINPKDSLQISFDAKVNHFPEDKLITVEPEFLDKQNKLISKASKKEVKALKTLPSSNLSGQTNTKNKL